MRPGANTSAMQLSVAREVCAKLRQNGYLKVTCTIVASPYESWAVTCGVFLPKGYAKWDDHIVGLVTAVLQQSYPVGYICKFQLIYDWRN